MDGTFNTNFLKLSPADKEKNPLVTFFETNQPETVPVSKEQMTAGTMWQLLNGIRNSGLKNDALMERLCRRRVPFLQTIIDIPVKAADHEHGQSLMHLRAR